MARTGMKLRESRENLPPGFVFSGAADPDNELKLRIALVQSNPEGLIDALYAVSTPGSPSYGEHLSKEEESPIPSCSPFSQLMIDARWRHSSPHPMPRRKP